VRCAAPVALLTLLLFVAPAPARAEDPIADELKDAFAAIDSWRIDEAREIAERWYARDPENPLVLALLGEVKLHMSDYAGAEAFYARAERAGAPEPLLRSAPLATAAHKATKSYVEVVGDNFIIRHSGGKDAILVPYALETLESAKKRIGDLLGWRPASRVVIELYPSAGTLADVSTLTRDEIKASGTIALCKWNRLMVTTPRAIVFGYSWRDTIAHELAHLIIGGASRNTVPIWLHEGIAKFVETAWRAQPGLGLSVAQQKQLRDSAKKGKLIPFSKMHPSMAKLKNQDETSLAFAEVFTFVEYMVELKGWEGMRKVLARMADGETDAEAIEAVFGVPLTTLSDRWMASLKNRPLKLEGTEMTAEREVVVKERPDAPDDQLHGVSKEGRRFARAADLLYGRGRVRAAQKELEKAIAQSPAPMLRAKLAVVALHAGDLEAAETAARGALEGSTDLAGPNVTLAEILVRRAKLVEAKLPLERALSINPFDPRIHELLLMVARGKGAEDGKLAKQAALALELLKKRGQLSRVSLGTGALVEIDGTPFSRVYVEHSEDDGTTQLEPTGMTTPTAAIELRPGVYKFRFIPPVGAPITRTLTVEPTPADGKPQKIASDIRGS
jgi:tetratricopeptide (TPR) repeat protein